MTTFKPGTWTNQFSRLSECCAAAPVPLPAGVRSCVRSTDCAGRLGGDEFIIVCAGMEDPERLHHVAARVQAKLHRMQRPLSASIGAVVFGVGWGLAGYCPGPGLVSLGTGGATAMIFVGAMTIGMVLQHQVAHMHTEPGGGLTTVVGKS